MGRRDRLGSISVSVDVAEVLEDLDDQDLIDELKARGRDANVVQKNALMAEVLLDVAEAFHASHYSGLPLYSCPHTLCRDAQAALHPSEKKAVAA